MQCNGNTLQIPHTIVPYYSSPSLTWLWFFFFLKHHLSRNQVIRSWWKLVSKLFSVSKPWCDSISVPKNPHCAGARTVPALYGCGPYSNLIFEGHWTLKKDKLWGKKLFFLNFFTVESENIALRMLLSIIFGCGCEYGYGYKHL